MSNQNRPNLYLKYSSITLQMAVIIGFSSWGGKKMDDYFKYEFPIFTVVLSLFGIAAALYLVLKDFIRPQK